MLKELKVNEPVKIIEVSNHIKRPAFLGEDESSISPTEINLIKMKVFTDGDVIKESKNTIESIDEYYFGKEKYQHHIDTLKTKEVYFKNYSYIITYLIAEECAKVGNLRGSFSFIKEVDIYLNNLKDKKALRKAKKVVLDIDKTNNSISHSSSLSLLFAKRRYLMNFAPEKITEEVYKLK